VHREPFDLHFKKGFKMPDKYGEYIETKHFELNEGQTSEGRIHGYSLTEARNNFDLYLTIYRPAEDSRIGGPDTQREREIKGKIIVDRAVSSPSGENVVLHEQLGTKGLILSVL